MSAVITVLFVLAAWTLLSFPAAVFVGRLIRVGSGDAALAPRALEARRPV